jgi:hypothetical protein
MENARVRILTKGKIKKKSKKMVGKANIDIFTNFST